MPMTYLEPMDMPVNHGPNLDAAIERAKKIQGKVLSHDELGQTTYSSVDMRTIGKPWEGVVFVHKEGS